MTARTPRTPRTEPAEPADGPVWEVVQSAFYGAFIAGPIFDAFGLTGLFWLAVVGVVVACACIVFWPLPGYAEPLSATSPALPVGAPPSTPRKGGRRRPPPDGPQADGPPPPAPPPEPVPVPVGGPRRPVLFGHAEMDHDEDRHRVADAVAERVRP